MSNASNLGEQVGANQSGYFSRLGDAYLSGANQFGQGIGNIVTGPLTLDVNKFGPQGIGNTIVGAGNMLTAPLRAIFGGSSNEPKEQPQQPSVSKTTVSASPVYSDGSKTPNGVSVTEQTVSKTAPIKTVPASEIGAASGASDLPDYHYKATEDFGADTQTKYQPYIPKSDPNEKYPGIKPYLDAETYNDLDDDVARSIAEELRRVSDIAKDAKVGWELPVMPSERNKYLTNAELRKAMDYSASQPSEAGEMFSRMFESRGGATTNSTAGASATPKVSEDNNQHIDEDYSKWYYGPNYQTGVDGRILPMPKSGGVSDVNYDAIYDQYEGADSLKNFVNKYGFEPIDDWFGLWGIKPAASQGSPYYKFEPAMGVQTNIYEEPRRSWDLDKPRPRPVSYAGEDDYDWRDAYPGMKPYLNKDNYMTESQVRDFANRIRSPYTDDEMANAIANMDDSRVKEFEDELSNMLTSDGSSNQNLSDIADAIAYSNSLPAESDKMFDELLGANKFNESKTPSIIKDNTPSYVSKALKDREQSKASPKKKSEKSPFKRSMPNKPLPEIKNKPKKADKPLPEIKSKKKSKAKK